MSKTSKKGITPEELMKVINEFSESIIKASNSQMSGDELLDLMNAQAATLSNYLQNLDTSKTKTANNTNKNDKLDPFIEALKNQVDDAESRLLIAPNANKNTTAKYEAVFEKAKDNLYSFLVTPILKLKSVNEKQDYFSKLPPAHQSELLKALDTKSKDLDKRNVDIVFQQKTKRITPEQATQQIEKNAKDIAAITLLKETINPKQTVCYTPSRRLG